MNMYVKCLFVYVFHPCLRAREGRGREREPEGSGIKMRMRPCVESGCFGEELPDSTAVRRIFCVYVPNLLYTREAQVGFTRRRQLG